MCATYFNAVSKLTNIDHVIYTTDSAKNIYLFINSWYNCSERKNILIYFLFIVYYNLFLKEHLLK